ncbi:hypothetical protein [Dyella koreensis]|uniref:Uncharacterized protein n=1 Tax=Dyella koreensis TaxID=311235 RepID=A0ABW8K3Q2_9GAMM
MLQQLFLSANEKTSMCRLVVVWGLGIAAALSPFISGYAACLPDDLVGVLSQQHPGWKVVGLGDLRVDDQAILRRFRLDECPGVAKGRFNGRDDAYAVTLFDRRGGLKQVLLVLTPSTASGVTHVDLISPPERVDVLSVVSRAPPGNFSGVDGSQVRIRNDSIKFETLEAGSLVYYFDGRSYRSMQISE